MIKASLTFISLLLISKLWAAPHSSILLFNEWDYERCPVMAEKASRELHNTEVLVMPTLHFTPGSKSDISGWSYESKEGVKKYTIDIAEKIETSLTQCLEVLRKNKVKVSLMLHIDDATKSGKWRNDIIFSPWARHEGHSYVSALLIPSLIAAKKAKVNFSHIYLSGEMGATVFHYPLEYLDLYKAVKRVMPTAQVGLCLNFNKIGGSSFKYSREKMTQVQKLMTTIDTLGVSAYWPTKRIPTVSSFEKGISDFRSLFIRKGIKLKKERVIHFCEVGVGGGGRDNSGVTPAISLKDLAKAPYSGIYGAYSKRTDPWQRISFKAYRRSFYRALNGYLKKYPETKAFLWNANSWDIEGLYPGSEGYRDPKLSRGLIKIRRKLKSSF